MNVFPLNSSLALLATAALLTACGGTPGGSQIIAMPEETQRQAIMACQAERGINIPEAVNVLRISPTSVAVSVVNGPGLSLSEARAINQCAQFRLLGGTIPVAAAAPVTKEPSFTKSGDYADAAPHTGQQHDASFVPAGCVRGEGTIQRGSLVCPGY